MAYNNYKYGGGQPYGGYGNSQRPPYNPSYNRYGNSGMRSYQGVQQSRKKSGCKIQMMDGSPIISGWKVSKGQMITLYARPYKGSKETTSKNGKNWINLFVTLVNKTTMQETKTSGLFDLDKKKLYIKDFNLIATSNGQGGYFGKHISKTYNR